MPRKCLTCSHKKRHQIEWDIIQGVSLLEISRKYSASYDSLHYHSQTHLKQNLLDKAKDQESEHLESILDFIQEHLSTAPQVEYNKLVNAADELNDVMGLNPPIETEAGPVALKEGIRKAMTLIEEGDSFKASTEKVLKEFRNEEDRKADVKDVRDTPKSGRKNLHVFVDKTARADPFENFESISEPYAFDGIDLPSKPRAAKADPDDYIPETNVIPSENSDPAWLKDWRRKNRTGPV